MRVSFAKRDYYYYLYLASSLAINVSQFSVRPQVRKFIEYTLRNKPQTKAPPHTF